MGIKIWNPKKLNIPPRFKKFSNKIAKTTNGLKNMLHADTLLKKAFHSVFNKKLFKRAAGATVVGVGIHYVMKYINTNSGCFLKDSSNVHCKVKNFSCCQKEAIDELPFCPEGPNTFDPCGTDFDEDKEQSCCKLCSCDHYDCKPGQKLECQRPSVGEALTHFAHEAVTGFARLIPGLDSFFYAVVGLFVLLIALKLFRRNKG